MPFKDLRNQGQKIRSHHLGAGRACIDMAMGAALVAAVAQVDLERGQNSPLQWRKQCGTDGQWCLSLEKLIFSDRGKTLRAHATMVQLAKADAR